MLVGLYITAAYWFTASTSFANPAVAIARSLTNTFSGIRPVDLPGFVLAQLVGAICALVFTGWLLRSHAELAAIVKANPFPDAATAHPNHLLVHFHRDPFPMNLLPLAHDGPERLAAHGRELFVDYPDDVGHSELPQAMNKAKFPKLVTARNWNTVLKLVELTR